MVFYQLTDEDCIIQETFKDASHSGIPVFYNDGGVIESVTDYMIYKSVTDTDQKTSVKTYADQLQTFLRFLDDDRKITWDKVMDRELIQWRNLLLEKGRSPNYIINCLKAVFKFYEWAERNKYIRKHVAIYDDDSDYPISAKQGKTKTWSWPYYPSSVSKQMNTPTNEQLESVHVGAIEASETVGLRDSLLMSIYEVTARRSEALQIKVSDIPDWDEIEENTGTDKKFQIEIIGKRSIVRCLDLLPETMAIAREYIEGDREIAVANAKKRDVSYKEPEEMFIGGSTGLPLNKEYVSRRISTLMKSSGVKASGHRIRAKALTDVVAAFDGYDEKGNPYRAEDVLIRAAMKAGQTRTESLKPYLALSRSSGIAAKLNNIELQRITAVQLAKKKKELANIKKLTPLLNAVLEGQDIEAELIKLLEDTGDWNTGTSN